jgi:hypothetical protein
MNATYSLIEIKILLRSIGLDEIDILKEVLSDEEDCYTSIEKKAIEQMIRLIPRFLARKQLFKMQLDKKF